MKGNWYNSNWKIPRVYLLGFCTLPTECRNEANTYFCEKMRQLLINQLVNKLIITSSAESTHELRVNGKRMYMSPYCLFEWKGKGLTEQVKMKLPPKFETTRSILRKDLLQARYTLSYPSPVSSPSPYAFTESYHDEKFSRPRLNRKDSFHNWV